jgi:CyaY protein
MNPREQEDSAFDKLASEQLRLLDRALSSFDPDEAESELAGDVLTITVGNRDKVVINRQRAARQIWLAALRRAWHFDYQPATQDWRTDSAELVSTLAQVLSEHLKRPIQIQLG